MSVYAALSEEECYLWAILSDPSGIDQMEFMIHDSAYKIQEKDGSVTQGLFRAWPFQVAWWRDRNPLVISQGSRCISEDTPVLTEYGWCPIQEVQVGDLVLTHKGRWRRVTEVFDNGVKDVVRCRVGDKFSVVCTIDHLFYVGDDYWVEAQSLNGTEVACFVDDEIQFLEVDYVGQELPASTWDLEVEEDHSFVANGMVVHNSAGKSLSCCAAALAFPFCYPGEEMVITAPENVHLQALTDKIETMYVNNRVPKEMLVRGVHGIKHKPYLQNFSNGARIMGRIPQRDGRGVKGVHPAVLLLDEACFTGDTLILTERGQVPIKDVLVGDRVLTHKGNWKRVLAVLDHGVRDTVTLSGERHFSVECTSNHHFWAKVSLDAEPEWIPARDMVGKFWLTKDGVSIEVVSATPSGQKTVYDLTVEDDSSYVANNIVAHNSDYPELAWNELIETVNQSSENAQWKAFGVTRGVRDKFYEYTTSDNWKVYRLPAMFRPTWSDEERAAKVAQYGSEDNVDYRRNILGVHSDAASPLFSAMQLGRCFIGETQVSVIVEDERLEAGHHIALTPISDVSIGDVVLNAVGSGTVVNKIASEHDEIYEIRVQGESIYGTGDHPVFTRRGWVPIRDLTTDDEIVTADGLPQLWEGLSGEGQDTLLKSLYG